MLSWVFVNNYRFLFLGCRFAFSLLVLDWFLRRLRFRFWLWLVHLVFCGSSRFFLLGIASGSWSFAFLWDLRYRVLALNVITDWLTLSHFNEWDGFLINILVRLAYCKDKIIVIIKVCLILFSFLLGLLRINFILGLRLFDAVFFPFSRLGRLLIHFNIINLINFLNFL